MTVAIRNTPARLSRTLTTLAVLGPALMVGCSEESGAPTDGGNPATTTSSGTSSTSWPDCDTEAWTSCDDCGECELMAGTCLQVLAMLCTHPEADPECGPYQACRRDCGYVDTTCIDGCAAQYPTAAGPYEAALHGCVCTECATECQAECSGDAG